MTPMIDVAFQLLVCFLCTASFAMPEMTLPATLPSSGAVAQASATEMQELGPIRVSLTREPAQLRIALNGTPVASVADLRHRLRQLSALANLPAVLHVGPDVNWAHVIEVYDSCLLAGVREIRLATPDP